MKYIESILTNRRTDEDSADCDVLKIVMYSQPASRPAQGYGTVQNYTAPSISQSPSACRLPARNIHAVWHSNKLVYG
jgi:hypothetical protein